MIRCGWTDCTLEVGLFDGVPSVLLSAEGRRNISADKARFVPFCAEHRELAAAKPQSRRFGILLGEIRSISSVLMNRGLTRLLFFPRELP
jgi:hypothetical protein